jgi:NAD+ kinase
MLPGKMVIRRIGFIIKHHHVEAAQLAVEMALYVLSEGRSVVFASESRSAAKLLETQLKQGAWAGRKGKPKIEVVEKAKMPAKTDLIVVFGGDGTYLSIARLMRTHSVPVMGVNMGQLGFLTEIKRSEAFETMQALLRGKAPTVSRRSLLEVTLRRKNKVIFQGPVVNDAVISKGAIARIIGIQVTINGQLVNTVRADGIIVSTPTGSTAYSLAAGGPILTPNLPALVLAPICPHSLTQRPLVVSDDAEIELKLSHRPGHVLLTLDGQDVVDLREDDCVTIRRFKRHSLELISAPSRDYFSLLREKLKFGMRD